MGFDLKKRYSSHSPYIGVVLDTSHHWESLSGFENAYFSARTYGLSVDTIPKKLEELFDLADLDSRAQDSVKSYSFGMRRKLSFIQALCHDPEVLILDEPTTGIDAHFLVALAKIIRERSDSGKTMGKIDLECRI